MLNKRIYTFINPKFLAIVTAGFMLLLGTSLVVQGQVDTRHYQEKIKKLVKDRTGRDLYIRGDMTVVLLPVPTVYIAGVELRDTVDGHPVPALSVEMLQLTPTLGTLFSDNPQISSLAFEMPTLEIERGKDNIIRWDWLNKEMLGVGTAESSDRAIALSISGGKITYRNDASNRTITIDNISASGVTGAAPAFDGSFNINEREVSFTVDASGSKPGSADMPLAVSLSGSDRSTAKLEGTLNLSSGVTKINGKLHFDIKDILYWAQPKEEKKELFAQLSGSLETEKEKLPALPIIWSGDWKQDGDAIDISNIVFNGLQSQGSGKIALTMADTTSVDTQMSFTTLDYAQWKILLGNVLINFSDFGGQSTTINEKRENPLPADMNISLDVGADKLMMGQQAWENVKIDIDMAEGAITVNQFHLELPGESDLSLFGVISQSATSGSMRFEGSVETKGKSLAQVLTIVDESAADLPDMGFGNFYLRSNVYVSNDQVRLSEADVKINELQLGGGLVAYYDANPRVEADVHLQDINFDYFRDLWRENQKDAAPTNFFLRFDKAINLSWLRKLQTNIDLKISVDRMTFLDRKGDNASFRLFAKQGELGIYNIRFYYPNDILEANFTLDVKGEKPFVNLLINTSQLDTDYFSAVPKKKVPEENKLQAPPVTGTPPADVPPPPPPADVPPPPPPADVPIPPPPAATGTETKAPPAAETEKVIGIVPQSSTTIQIAQNNDIASPSALTVDDLTVVRTPKPTAADTKRWSEELIDMSWMEGINGVFDISVGKFTHDDIVLERVKTRARIDNSLITIQSLSLAYWQGRCEVTGSLYGGKVPGMSIGFTIFNAEMQDFLKTLIGYDNISGKVSISGSLSTSGVNLQSWVSQAEAKMVLTGRGINVRGFNLQGVVDTVLVSRTASDVLNNVNRALLDGSTEMSVDGNINMKNGILRSPGIALKSGATTGNLAGDVSLVPWTMELAAFFQFPTMTLETIPTLLVQLNGSIDDPALRTDTSSLEAFVAKNIKQK